MSRRLVERKTCDVCGQVVDALDDGTEVGHNAYECAMRREDASLPPHGPPAVPEAQAPEPEEAAEVAGPAEADERAARPR